MKVTEKYKGFSRAEWATKKNISYKTFCERILAVGWEEAVNMERGAVATYKGLSRAEWAYELDRPIKTFSAWVLKKGWEGAIAYSKVAQRLSHRDQIVSPERYDNRGKAYKRNEKCKVCGNYGRCLDKMVRVKSNSAPWPCEVKGDFSDWIPETDAPAYYRMGNAGGECRAVFSAKHGGAL